MKYRIVLKTVTGPTTAEIGVMEVEGTLAVTDGALVLHEPIATSHGPMLAQQTEQIILAIPAGCWYYCEEARLIQPASSLKVQ